MGLVKRFTLIPQDVLGALLSVDGSGSQLDADLLDGRHAAAFVTVDKLGAPNGVAVLDENAKIDTSLLPLVSGFRQYDIAANSPGWTVYDNDFFQIIIYDSQLTGDEIVLADLHPSMIGGDSVYQAELDAYSKLMKIETVQGAVRIYAYEKPQAAFSLYCTFILI